MAAYAYGAIPEAQDQIDNLPIEALAYYAELVTFLQLTPWEGDPANRAKPDTAMRTKAFGPNAEGLATYVIIEHPGGTVTVVNVLWVD